MRWTRTTIAAGLATGLLAASVAPAAAQGDATTDYSFSRLGQVTESGAAQLRDIAVLPDGTIAVAGGAYTGNQWGNLVWASSDGGETWTETELDAEGGLETLGDHFVAIGLAQPNDLASGTAVHTSRDGISWDLAGTIEDIVPHDVIATPDGVAMLGEDRSDVSAEEDPGTPMFWTSNDAVDWQGVPITPPSADRPLLWDVRRTTDGTWLASGEVVSFGDDGEGPPAREFYIWSSVDGLEWTRETAPIPDVEQGFGVIHLGVATPAGLVVDAVGGSSADGLYLTADGSTWEQVASIPGPDIPVMATDGTTSIAFRLPIVEGDEGGPPALTEGAEVYVSNDGSTWEQPSILESGTVNAAAFAPDGRLLLAGADISDCREFFCIFDAGNGAVPTVWVGELQ
jgi:hypothetical protein